MGVTMDVKRILVFPGRISGGIGSVVMNLFRNIDSEKVQYDFCVSESDSGKFDNEICAKGGRVFRIPRIQKVGPFRLMSAVKKVIKDNGPYDGVHIHSVHMGALALVAAKKSGVKQRLYHVHSTKDAALEKIPFHKFLENILSKIIVKNRTVRCAGGQDAGRYVYGKETFTVVNNAIDLKKFSVPSKESVSAIKKELSLPDGKIIVGNIANFSPVKNQKFFLRLAETDKNGANKCFFVLVGDGNEFKAVKEDIDRKKLEDKFLLTGGRTDTDKLYKSFDVFCLPSIFEGLPVTLIEAQACGLPVITSSNVTNEADLNVVPYVRIDLNNPIQKWLDVIYSMSNNRCYNPEHIKNAFVASEYDIESVCKKIMQTYCFG